MILILDTSPICFLLLIGEIEVLPRLYERIVVPAVVLEELQHPEAPEDVRIWAGSPPPWLTVRSVSSALPTSFDYLDPGEREAIRLALSFKDSLLVLDDRIGREEAKKLGIEVTGLLGILLRADQRQLLDLPSALKRLQRTHFYVSPGLIQSLLASHSSNDG